MSTVIVPARGPLSPWSPERFREIEAAIRRGDARLGFLYTIRHRDLHDRLLWEMVDQHNLLHDEGEKFLLSASFATGESGYGPPPANLYLGLRSGSIAETDTLATITEVTGTGYARIAAATNGGFALSQGPQVSGDWQAKTGNLVFTAGGTWAAATAAFLASVSSGTSGKLLSSVALSTTRSLVNGDTLTASMTLVMSE